MHLTPEQLVDAAEGGADRDATQHLHACAACRDQLADLRAMISDCGELGADVPEPSPAFWGHFQRRVVAAAAAGPSRESAVARFVGSLRPAFALPAAAAFAVALVLLVGIGRGDRHASVPSTSSSAQVVQTAAGRAEVLGDPIDDPSLRLIADLSADVDWSAADATGFTASGSADHAVSHLDVQDLKELQRLLRAELGT